MKTLIMDLDGTLIDSVPDICASLNRALTSKNLTPTDTDQVKATISLGARGLVERAVNRGNSKEDVDIDIMLDLFLAEYSARPIENTVVYPGVMDVLGRLKSEGALLGICTNKPEKTAWPVLRALGLDEFFPVVVCGDTLPYKKPDKRHVHKVIDLLDGDAASAVFVGDSEVDIAAARNAGLPMVLVSYGYSMLPAQDHDVESLIDHFIDLPETLISLK